MPLGEKDLYSDKRFIDWGLLVGKGTGKWGILFPGEYLFTSYGFCEDVHDSQLDLVIDKRAVQLHVLTNSEPAGTTTPTWVGIVLYLSITQIIRVLRLTSN